MTMKKFLFAILLAGVMATPAFAGGMQTVGGSTTPPTITMSVYNDSGGTIESGAVVVWDNDDTEFDRSGYPYVTTTTTADHDWVAGVVAEGLTCPAGQMCEIVIYGPARTQLAQSTDAVTEDVQVATSGVAGRAGDWGAGANTCSLGLVMDGASGGVDCWGGTYIATDTTCGWVFVNPGCED
jgi:hypothetical protein